MAHYRLGEALSKKQNLDAAIASLQKAIWLNPDFSSPYILLGRIYYTKKQLEPAEGMLKHAVAMDPNNAIARYLFGLGLSVARARARSGAAVRSIPEAEEMKRCLLSRR